MIVDRITDDGRRFDLLLRFGGAELERQCEGVVEYEVSFPDPDDASRKAVGRFQSARPSRASHRCALRTAPVTQHESFDST